MKDTDPMIGDLFRALKPILGARVDQWWLQYELGDQKEKAAIREVVFISARKYLGIAPGDEKIRLEPPSAALIGGGEYTIGNVLYPGIAPYPATLQRKDLLRHVFILAQSGGGKSTFIIMLAKQVLRDSIPVIWADFKRNYRSLLADEAGKNVVVITVGRETAPLRLNMLQPPAGVASTEWIEVLADLISSSYLLMAGARNVMKAALRGAVDVRRDRATLRDALGIVTAQLVMARSGSRRYGWLESTHRSLEELTNGALGDALNATGQMTFEGLLTLSIVFELQSLGDDQKRCFCLYLLQGVLLLRKHQDDSREQLRSVLCFDEIQNLAPREQWGQLSVPSRLAREVREYGTALISASQGADIADSIIANSATTIVLRATWPKDVEIAGKLLQVEPKWISKIPLGQGIARLPGTSSFLFGFPAQPVKNVHVPDAVVAERYHAIFGNTAPASEVVAPIMLREKEVTLLLDIAAHPISTVTERYSRLSWNPNTGNTIKDSILHQGLADFETIDVGRTRMKILTLTPAGEESVIANGGTIRQRGVAGLEHEFWRARLRERCENRGYTVTEEFHLGERRRADLCATRNGRTILLEIETGKSNVAENIKKATGHTLVLFFTTNHARDATRDTIPDGILVLTPDTISELHTLLT